MAETKSNEKNETVGVEPLPAYEPPRIQVMTEREILNTFQVTQAMASWWASC